jgi:hypothetical protein
MDALLISNARILDWLDETMGIGGLKKGKP